MRAPIGVGVVLSCHLAAAGVRAEDPKAWALKHLDELVGIYRYLHQHPELSFHEKQTAARLADELQAAGYEVTRNVGGHGVVALMHNGDGPTLMLRADMDALPIVEQTGLVYSSQVKIKDDSGAEVGVMHACGHDFHTTNLIGVARFLATHKDHWQGTLMLIGQPAEERGLGARTMLAAGLFERFPKPAFALALHVDPFMPAGQVGYRSGYSQANVDSVDITIRGKGGHGAYPHTTIDPIVIAAKLVLDLQTIVSREMDPTESAVVTVGAIHGGTKHNVIPETCGLQLTVRSYTPAVRKNLLASIERKAKAAAASAGAPEPVVTVSKEGTPALFNDEKLVKRLIPTLKDAMGADNVVPAEPTMGGEDFSEYGLAGVPIFMFRLGVTDPHRLAGFKRLDQQPPSLHSPQFYPDAEPALIAGITAMSAAALDLLSKSEHDARTK